MNSAVRPSDDRGEVVTPPPTRVEHPGRVDRDEVVLASPPYRLAKGVVAGLGLSYALSTLISFGERPALLDTGFYTVVLICTCLLALARPVLVRRNRPAWILIALAVTSWSIGDIYWSVAFADAEVIPVPSPADAFYVSMYPLAYVGLILLARAGARRLPASVWLDGIVCALAAGAVFSAITLADVLAQAGGDDSSATLTNLAYPIGDLVLMVVSVAALAMVRWRPDPAWWLLGLGAAFFAVADTVYLFTLANHTYTDGNWVDGMWMLGLTFMALAGSAPRRGPVEEVRGFAALLVPILFSLSALGVLIFGTFVDLHAVTIALASACLVAAGARTAITFEQTRELARTQVAANTDTLSGLGNRRVLDSQLPTLLSSTSQGNHLVLTIISVDHLPDINSILGYSAGDMILNTVGTRLRDSVPADAVAARLGGVEMAVLRVVGPGSLSGVDRETRALLRSLASPVPAGGAAVHIELSAGIALAPMHATQPADLIRCAADALRLAKENGSEVELYDPAGDIGNEFGPAVFPDLLRAVERIEFTTYYQPKIDVGSGRPVAVEAVLRWHHPELGVVDVELVRPMAARVGLARQMTRILLESALNNCAAWRRQGVEFGVAVDVTAADVLDAQLPYDLARLINKLAVPPSVVTLEISEDVIHIDPRRTAAALGQFRHFGVRLALDHYGRSAPSLTRLRSTPVDELKLDRSFVGPILDSPQDAAVVRSTVELAKSLNIVTVAEGVDAPELFDAAVDVGCAGAQGDALAPAMTIDALRSWVGQHPPRQRAWRRDPAPAAHR
jgi:diguanylate cyclase (GGDEF)-like protein